jgi:hypothetical protein
VEAAKQQLAVCLDPLLEQMRAALTSTVAQSSTPVRYADPTQSREAAEQLARLLSDFDPGATEFIEAKQGELRPLFVGDGWTQFEKLVQSYSFAEAQRQLDEALKSFHPA